MRQCTRPSLVVTLLYYVTASRLARSFALLPGKRPARLGLAPAAAVNSFLLPSLEYSVNFQRHIVKNNNTVVGCYEFLDEALQRHPRAFLRPLRLPSLRESSTEDDSSAYSGTIHALNHRLMIQVAGAGQVSQMYDLDLATVDPDDQRQQLATVLEETLKWFPSQTEQLLEKCPSLLLWPPTLLQERLTFLLAPAANATALEDGAMLFYNQGQGAGLNIAQISHSLSVYPGFLLTLDPLTSRDHEQRFILPFLYTETPTVVLEMATKQLDILRGTRRIDVAACAYHHYRGWEWESLRQIALSLPSIFSLSLEPSWELYERGSTPIRNPLDVASLWYLQLRLQAQPHVLLAMLRAHPPLSYYTVQRMEAILNCLQEVLSINSRELRQLVLRLPSLLGASVNGTEKRVAFWTDQVHLSPEQLRSVVIGMPALLQYNIEDNLQAKLDFLTRTLGIAASKDLAAVTMRAPRFWGKSLVKSEAHVASLVSECSGISYMDYGAMVTQAPELLLFNWDCNLAGKIKTLRQSLALGDDKLCQLLRQCPRVLTQHSETLLATKIQAIEERLGSVRATHLVLDRPSLLLYSLSKIGDQLSPKKIREQSAVTRRRSRVLLLEPEGAGVAIEFPSVAAAARHAGVSASHMHRVLQKDALLRGKRYIKRTSTNMNLSPVQATASPKAALAQRVSCDDAAVQRPQLQITCTGRAYPSESVMRGRRRAGGMAIQIPSFSRSKWATVCNNLWAGQRFRLLSDAHTVILGYSYTRPSRPRTTLYTCREALRVAFEYISPSLADTTEVLVQVDSAYVLDILQNTTAVRRWGSCATREDFDAAYDGPMPLYRANPDILFPLSKTFHKLVTERNATARFEVVGGSHNKRVDEGAKLAAKLMYDML